MLQAHLGNALPHQLGAEAEVVAVGPACLTMTGNLLSGYCFRCEQLFFSGIAAWMTTWKGVHVNGKRQVLREVLLLPKSQMNPIIRKVEMTSDDKQCQCNNGDGAHITIEIMIEMTI